MKIEKWAIKRTPENYKVVNDWFNKNNQIRATPLLYSGTSHYMHYPKYCSLFHSDSNLQDGYTEITFEQFLKITNQENTMEKKLIGYRCPTDLYNGVIKKNSLYMGFGYKDKYCPEHDYCPRNIAPLEFSLPKEIVETWEKVFEEEKITICGKEVELGRFGMKSVVIDGMGYSKEELYTLHALMLRGQIKSLNVGCNGQETVDLKLIEKILAKL